MEGEVTVSYVRVTGSADIWEAPLGRGAGLHTGAGVRRSARLPCTLGETVEGPEPLDGAADGHEARRVACPSCVAAPRINGITEFPCILTVSFGTIPSACPSIKRDCFLFRNRKNRMTAMLARAASPPTTAPAMAPVLLEEEPPAAGAVGDDELLEVSALVRLPLDEPCVLEVGGVAGAIRRRCSRFICP